MYRVEDKFILDSNNYHEIVKRVYGLGGIEIHNARRVNSLYFDTDSLANYRDSIEGCIPRSKTRIRWYGEKALTDVLQINIERKYQTENGRFKSSRILQSGERSFIINSRGIWDNEMGNTYPSALIEYRRRYFQLKDVRITLDTDITYFSVNESNWKFTRESIDSRNVLEFKYENVLVQDLMELPNLENVKRFSKYCNAIDAIKAYKWIL
jgi:SPX domain protein involved in polyphosphate accumulation